MGKQQARKSALSAVRSAQNGMKPALSRLIFARFLGGVWIISEQIRVFPTIHPSWRKRNFPRRSPHLSELPHVRGGSLTESAEYGGLRSFAAIGHRVNRKTNRHSS